MANKTQYIWQLKGHISYTLFGLVSKTLKLAGAEWGDPDFTHILEEQWQDWESYEAAWRRLTKACVDHINIHVKKATLATYNAEGYEPTYANFFKSTKYVDPILKGSLTKAVVKLAAKAIAP